ncbi:MAG: Gfo/Idh/MocA family protein, partial [Maioricimonas sp. JB049]
MKVEDFLKHECNRRQFLGNSARNAAGLAVGVAGLGNAATAAPSERVRVGVIGLGARGSELCREFSALRDVDVAAVADPDTRLLGSIVDEMPNDGRGPIRAERDFRRLLDDPSLHAVVIATPDHWHAAMTVMACQAGKDVYVEAPLSHHLNEGRRIAEVAAETGRVVQTGLQQRSGAHFRSAIELVQGGGIGHVRIAKAWVVHRRKPVLPADDAAPPRGVDYSLWLGPASARSFNTNHFHRNWMWYWDHGGGELGLWGVHLLDVARWGLGVDWPQRISATGGKLYFDDDRETPDTLNVQFEFGDTTI